MSWVRKTPPPSEEHECKPPMRERVVQLPAPPPTRDHQDPKRIEHRDTVPDGEWEDLWRCPCGKLWRVAALSRRSGEPLPVNPPLQAYAWRPATWWQRLRHSGEGYDHAIEQWEGKES